MLAWRVLRRHLRRARVDRDAASRRSRTSSTSGASRGCRRAERGAEPAGTDSSCGSPRAHARRPASSRRSSTRAHGARNDRARSAGFASGSPCSRRTRARSLMSERWVEPAPVRGYHAARDRRCGESSPSPGIRAALRRLAHVVLGAFAQALAIRCWALSAVVATPVIQEFGAKTTSSASACPGAAGCRVGRRSARRGDRPRSAGRSSSVARR